VNVTVALIPSTTGGGGEDSISLPLVVVVNILLESPPCVYVAE